MPVEAVPYFPPDGFEERLAHEQRQWEGPGTLTMKDVELKVCQILQMERILTSQRPAYLAYCHCHELSPRLIGNGLIRDYPLETLVGRRVVVLANVEPVTFHGLPSNGLILCAQKGDQVELLKLPKKARTGDRLEVKGWKVNHKKISTITHGMFNTIAKDLLVDSERIVRYKGVPLRVVGKKGYVKSWTLTDCEVKCPLRY